MPSRLRFSSPPDALRRKCIEEVRRVEGLRRRSYARFGGAAREALRGLGRVESRCAVGVLTLDDAAHASTGAVDRIRDDDELLRLAIHLRRPVSRQSFDEL